MKTVNIFAKFMITDKIELVIHKLYHFLNLTFSKMYFTFHPFLNKQEKKNRLFIIKYK
jgi:hypothetical protein